MCLGLANTMPFLRAFFHSLPAIFYEFINFQLSLAPPRARQSPDWQSESRKAFLWENDTDMILDS
jgi:hypothetical protein